MYITGGVTALLAVDRRGCLPSQTVADTSNGCRGIGNLQSELAEGLEMISGATVSSMSGMYCVCDEDNCN